MAVTGWRVGAACMLALALCSLAQQAQATKFSSRDKKVSLKANAPQGILNAVQRRRQREARKEKAAHSTEPLGQSIQNIIDDLNGERRHEFGGTVELNATMFSLEVKNSMLNHMKVRLPEQLTNYKNPTWLEDHPALHAEVSQTSFFHNCYNEYRHLLPPVDGYEEYKRKQMRKEKRAKENVVRARSIEAEDFTDKVEYNRRAACAPYFVVIGAHGLSANHTANMLKLHSRHVLTVNFERHNYWDYRQCTEAVNCHSDFLPPTFADYKSLHQGTCEHARRQSFFMEDGEEYHPDVVGDVFTGFLNWNPCWKKIPGNEGRLTPRVTSAHHVHALMPNLKVIMLMRNPIKKTLGLFRSRFDRHYPWSQADAKMYHDEMETEVKKFQACKKDLGMNTKQCVYHFIDSGEDTILAQSIYSVFVEDYKNIFPQQNIMFVRYEDFRHDGDGEIDDIIHFLGVPSRPVDIEDVDVESSADRGVAPFDETMQMLHDFYRPYDSKLKELIGDKFTWY